MRHVLSPILVGALIAVFCGACITGQNQGNGQRQGDVLIPVPNGDFEKEDQDWLFFPGRGDCRITDRHAAGGKHSLQIIGSKAMNGAKVESPTFPVDGPGMIELRGKICAFSGRHLGLYIREYDVAGNVLMPMNHGELGGIGGTWKPWLRQLMVREETTHLQLFILGYPNENERIEVYLDDLEFVRPFMPIPPWPGEYKLCPGDRDKLTAADVVGPDGVVYPNWTQVGVQGGIPHVPVVAKIEDFGGTVGADISDALGRACKAVGAKGGGAVLLGEGTYFMDRPLTIREDGVVIRGSGREKTRVHFRHGPGKSRKEISFYWPEEGGTIGPDTIIETHASHYTIRRMRLFMDGKEVASEAKAPPWGYRLRVKGDVLRKAGGKGKVTLRAEVEFADDGTLSTERTVLLSGEPQPVKAGPDTEAVLLFRGGMEAAEHFLKQDGKRGDVTLAFKNVGDLKVGDRIILHAPLSDSFCERIRDRSPRGWNRVGFFEIKAVTGNSVTINQPLRIDFPFADGTFARRLRSVVNSGIEDLTIRHLGSLPINSVTFRLAWNCWAKNLTVTMTGRNGVYAANSKWIEIRDCVLDRSWNNDGGQAYAGFTRSADCLMDHCLVKKYRHGPVVQFGAMGCVFRNSTFDGSDMQWHAGWSTENLFENCVVKSRQRHGSYGFGAYATGSGDLTHGPNGPRNVVYNCDVRSGRDGVSLHGVNENWLFLHNRFVVKEGAGFTADCGSFDMIIRNNTFIIEDRVSPMLRLKTPDCVGVELIGNRVYGGSGTVYEGGADLEQNEKNVSFPSAAGAVPPRPAAEPASIYEWQNRPGR